MAEVLGVHLHPGGAVLQAHAWERLGGLRDRRRKAAAVVLQRAWRCRSRGRVGEVLQQEMERSLIETVLQKYERLQRQSESLAYSFYSDSSAYTGYARGGEEAQLPVDLDWPYMFEGETVPCTRKWSTLPICWFKIVKASGWFQSDC